MNERHASIDNEEELQRRHHGSDGIELKKVNEENVHRNQETLQNIQSKNVTK